MSTHSLRSAAYALGAYVVIALVFVWPLPMRIGSALTGPVTGDTGVYVWNLWLFRHEILAHGRLPLFTSEILSLTPPIDLSLHNYTIFANLLAFPLLAILDIVTVFNVVYLVVTVMTAMAMFFLARTVVANDPAGWLAGLLFAFSPVLVARSTAHFSLAAAAPLPLFVLCLMHLERTPRVRYAMLAGAMMAWAAMCDAYYGVYCVLIAFCYVAVRAVDVQMAGPKSARPGWMATGLMVMIALVAMVIGTILWTGGTAVEVAGVRIAMRSLYTPVLALTVLVAALGWVSVRPTLRIRWPEFASARVILAGGIVCALLLAPLFYALSIRFSQGGSLTEERVYWRSSPPGVDVLSFILPNANHPVIGSASRAWLTARPNGFVENVAALTFTGLALLVVAWWGAAFRPPRLWVVLTVAFAALALGPFIHVAGTNTYVPGPWALMRYVPVIGSARTPARFTIVMMMGFSVLVALAVADIARRAPKRRQLVFSAVAIALVAELWPAPRTLYSAEIPSIYRTIASDPRDIRVLELPWGIRDGVSSVGNFSASTQFYQTIHEKRLIGGYLSRIPRTEVRRQRRVMMLRALMLLSEGQKPSQPRLEILRARGAAFVQRARVGYVIIDRTRATPELQEFAIQAFGLVKMGEDGARDLYRPTAAARLAERDPMPLRDTR